MRRAEHMTRSPVLSCGSCRCHQRQQLVRHEHAAAPALLEPAHRLVYAPGRDRVQRDSYHPRARVRSRPVGIRDGGRARSSARRDLCRPLLALVLLRPDGTHEEQDQDVDRDPERHSDADGVHHDGRSVPDEQDVRRAMQRQRSARRARTRSPRTATRRCRGTALRRVVRSRSAQVLAALAHALKQKLPSQFPHSPLARGLPLARGSDLTVPTTCKRSNGSSCLRMP